MYIVLGIFVGLLVLMTLIVAHEFGHFLMARHSGVTVKEFGIGFPPRIFAWLVKKDKNGKRKWEKLPKKDWGKDQNSLIFSINALPIGGFCAMDGESDDDSRKGTFGSVSYWEKTLILFGGVLMNWLVAFIILTVLAFFGLPTLLENQFSIKSDEHIKILESVSVVDVMENSPAEAAGFKSGDKIIEIYPFDPSESRSSSEYYDQETGKNLWLVRSSEDVINFNNEYANKNVYYKIEREENDSTEQHILEAKLNNSDSDYLLGITMDYGSSTTSYTWSAPIVAAGLTVQITGETFKGLWSLLVNLITGTARQVSSDSSVREEGRTQISEASAGVSGIVGIIGGYFPIIVKSGPSTVFLFMAVISISLACMNVLPIPALDGGRWLMITLARLRHKKLSKELEQKIVAKAFIFLLILMALITVLDIIRLF